MRKAARRRCGKGGIRRLCRILRICGLCDSFLHLIRERSGSVRDRSVQFHFRYALGSYQRFFGCVRAFRRIADDRRDALRERGRSARRRSGGRVFGDLSQSVLSQKAEGRDRRDDQFSCRDTVDSIWIFRVDAAGADAVGHFKHRLGQGHIGVVADPRDDDLAYGDEHDKGRSRRRPRQLSRRRACAGRDAAAGDVQSGRAGGEVGHHYEFGLGNGQSGRRDDGGDDGCRQRPGVSQGAFLQHPHIDDQYGRRDGLCDGAASTGVDRDGQRAFGDRARAQFRHRTCAQTQKVS